MKDIILITGANGNLAKVLTTFLDKNYEIRFLTTNSKLATQDSCFHWNIKKGLIDINALKNCKHIIHLAGYPILNRWTERNKKLIYDSRIKSSNLLFKYCKKLNIKIDTFICASAIGIYPSFSKEEITEDATKGNNWVSQMVTDWEISAKDFKKIGSRVITMRIPLIFHPHSGFLKYTLLSMRYGIGLIIGNSNRIVNWIHTDDVSRFIMQSIENKNYDGAYNLACDKSITQKDFIKLIKDHLYPYAITIKIPKSIIKLFIGNRIDIITTNLSLNTNKLKQSGFTFKFNNLISIIDDLKSNN